MDTDSENAMQIVLKNAFDSSTVLLIAHRLNGLQQTNRVFLVDGGGIIEEGNPQELAKDEQSKFHALLQEQKTSQFKTKSA